MKKLLFLVPLAAVALASCSNDEQISRATVSDTQELTIRPIVGNTTRAVITDANFDQFHVKATVTDGAFWRVASTATEAPTAEPTEDGAVQTTLSLDVLKNGGKWDLFGTNETNYKWYWSSKNANGTFVGYNQGEGTFTVADAIADQKDVLVASNAGTASEFSNGVPMLFRHALSQIVIKADNKDADIRQIKVGGVRLHNIFSEATLAHPNPASIKTTAGDFDWTTTTYTPWSGLATAKKYVYYHGTAPASNAVYSSSTITLNATAQDITFQGPALMLPQTVAAATNLTTATATGGYFDILIQVQNLESSANTAEKKAIFPKIAANAELSTQTYAWVAVPVAIDWKPGFKYTYVLHFSKDGIGKASPDEEGGNTDPGTDPGTDVIDNPVPLYFTVTIDEWQDASTSPEEKDL